MSLTQSQMQAVSDAAFALGVNPIDLAAVIQHESAFNPTANYAGHYGLIQFSDSSAQQIGFNSATDLIAQYPDVESQIKGPVLRYLAWVKKTYGNISDPQNLCMAIFAPAYIGYSPDTSVSSDIQNSNPGIYTIQDYVNLVNGAYGSIPSQWPGPSFMAYPLSIVEGGVGEWAATGMLAAALFLGFYWLLRRR